MSWINRLGNLFRTRKLDLEIDEEIQFHLESRLRDNIRTGMPAAEARQDAARRRPPQAAGHAGRAANGSEHQACHAGIHGSAADRPDIRHCRIRSRSDRGHCRKVAGRPGGSRRSGTAGACTTSAYPAQRTDREDLLAQTRAAATSPSLPRVGDPRGAGPGAKSHSVTCAGQRPARKYPPARTSVRCRSRRWLSGSGHSVRPRAGRAGIAGYILGPAGHRPGQSR